MTLLVVLEFRKQRRNDSEVDSGSKNPQEKCLSLVSPAIESAQFSTVHDDDDDDKGRIKLFGGGRS